LAHTARATSNRSCAAVMRYLLIALMLFPGVTVAADSLGRLFTTPAERASLDYLRQTKKVEVLETDKPAEAEAAPTVPSSISVQGYVKRGDGQKGTVWVNQKPMQESSGTDEVQVGKLRSDGNQVQLKLPANGKSLSLKAGQVYVPETDSVSENSGRIEAVQPKKETKKRLMEEPVAETPNSVRLEKNR
jgi:hypothetical protein